MWTTGTQECVPQNHDYLRGPPFPLDGSRPRGLAGSTGPPILDSWRTLGSKHLHELSAAHTLGRVRLGHFEQNAATLRSWSTSPTARLAKASRRAWMLYAVVYRQHARSGPTIIVEPVLFSAFICMEPALQEHQSRPDYNPLNDLLPDLRRRVTRAGQPAYQAINEMGCFVEAIDTALHKTFPKARKEGIGRFKNWLRYLKDKGVSAPQELVILDYIYGWRNCCSHDSEDRETFGEETPQDILPLVEKACWALEQALAVTNFRAVLTHEQTYYPPLRQAYTLATALRSCQWNDELQRACLNYAGDALRLSEATLPATPRLPDEILDALLLPLSRLCAGEHSSHLCGLANELQQWLSSPDREEHLEPWLARNGVQRRPATESQRLPTLRLTIDEVEADGTCCLAGIELLYPHEPGLMAPLQALSDSILEPGQFVDVCKAAANVVAARLGLDPDGVVFLVRTCEPWATVPFHLWSDQRGVQLGEQASCVAAQLLLEPLRDLSYGRRTLSGPIVSPLIAQSNTLLISEPRSPRQIGLSQNQKRFDFLLAVQEASGTTARCQELTRGFEGFPLAVFETSGEREIQPLVDELFGSRGVCTISSLFERIKTLRHPEDEPGVPLVVLWDDPGYHPKQPSTIGV